MNLVSTAPSKKPLIITIAATAAALALTGCGGGGSSAGFSLPNSQAPAPAPASQAAVPAPAPASQAAAPVPPPAGSLIGNTTPISNAGAAQSATAGTTVKLDGSASTDADNDALSYAWTLVSKPAGSASTLVDANTAKPTFIPDVAGSYVASLIVNDGKVNSDPSTVTVTAADVVAFDSIPSPFPLHMPSYPFATLPQLLASLGERIALQPGTPRTLSSVTVGMESWACETGSWSTGCKTTPNSSFTHPITLSIYNDNGDLLAARTQTFTIPYMPTPDPTCSDPTMWRAADGNCYHGAAFPISFDLHALKVALPDTFTYTVSYDTSATGFPPMPMSGPYDSLNVGAYESPATKPSVGSETQPGRLLLNGVPSNEGYAMMARFSVTAP